jgi:hypothetical protein
MGRAHPLDGSDRIDQVVGVDDQRTRRVRGDVAVDDGVRYGEAVAHRQAGYVVLRAEPADEPASGAIGLEERVLDLLGRATERRRRPDPVLMGDQPALDLDDQRASLRMVEDESASPIS